MSSLLAVSTFRPKKLHLRGYFNLIKLSYLFQTFSLVPSNRMYQNSWLRLPVRVPVRFLWMPRERILTRSPGIKSLTGSSGEGTSCRDEEVAVAGDGAGGESRGSSSDDVRNNNPNSRVKSAIWKRMRAARERLVMVKREEEIGRMMVVGQQANERDKCRK